MQQEFDTPEAALEHFGVKGMKWGVRRDRTATRARLAAEGPRKHQGKLTVLANTYGSKDRFISPEGMRLRQEAGRERAQGLLIQYGGLGISALGAKAGSPGVAAVGNLVSLGGSARSIRSVVTANKAIKREREYRSRS